MIDSPVSRLAAAVLAAVALTASGAAWAQTGAPGVLSTESPATESPAAEAPVAQPVPRARPLMLLPPKMPETPAETGTNPNPPILRPNFADTAPLPSPPSGVAPMAVEMNTLRSIDPDSAGTLDPQQGGFPYGMWRDTPRGVIEALIPRLPTDVRSRTARALIQRLLTTAAGVPAPADKADSGAVIAARARQLAAMGAGMAVLDLLDATPARETVPALARTEAEVRLGENDLNGACRVVAANFERDTDPFWQKTMVLCQALDGAREKASLGLALLREMGNDDPAYFTLMDGLVNGVPVVLERMPNPSPLTLAAARVAKVPLPNDVVFDDRPAILRTVATSPYADIATRLEAAERAESAGALDVETLRRIYASVEFDAAELAGPITTAETVRGSRARALLYRTALTQDVPTARAEVMAQALEMAREDGRFGLVARVFEPVLLRIPPSTDLTWFAPDAVRAMLILGSENGLQAWLELLRNGAKYDAEMEKVLAGLRPVLFLAGLEADPNADGASVLADWWKTVGAQGASTGKVTLLLATFEAFSGPLPGKLWEPLLADADRQTVAFPQPALWFRLASAATEGRLGETVALSLIVLGGGGLADVEPVTFSRVLADLRKIGLDAEARSLAVEAALAVGL